METVTDPMKAIEQLKDADTLGAEIDILMHEFFPMIHRDIQCEIAATTKNNRVLDKLEGNRSIKIRRALASNPALGAGVLYFTESKDRETRENAWATYKQLLIDPAAESAAA